MALKLQAIEFIFILLFYGVAFADEPRIPQLLVDSVPNGVYSVIISGMKVFYAQNHDLSRGSVMEVPISGGPPREFIAIPGSRYSDQLSVHRGFLYWLSENAHGRLDLFRVPLDRSRDPELVREMVSRYVLEGDNLYLIESRHGDVIRKFLLSGREEVLFSSFDLFNPRGIALDRGNVYAVFAGLVGIVPEATGTAYRIPKSGGPTELLADRLSYPRGLAIYRDRLYWTNFITGQLVELSLVSQKPRVLWEDRNSWPHALGQNRGWIYFSRNWTSETSPCAILRYHPSTKELETVAGGPIACAVESLAFSPHCLVWAGSSGNASVVKLAR